jgi:phenylalanyl-tRNA synthetase beta chain
MKVLLSWLREFAPIEGEVGALGEQLSDLGLAVESTDILGEGLDGIVVAKVLELREHPKADKIQLVDVDLGDGEALQICCGAFNMAVGDLVPLATLGTTMPGGMKIERRKLRGEYSNGMLCSATELGMGDDHSGIMVLSPDLELGTPLVDALGLAGDVLWDLEVNPNRPDAMSVAGVARDLAARLRVPFAIPEPSVTEAGAAVGEIGEVDIVDADLCGRFLVRVLRGIQIGPSPTWMASRLTALGMRPISNVVDVSNYVMLELGQPNHTYDLALVPEGRLGTRWAKEGEIIETLDGVERILTAQDGVIVDHHDQAIGIAGVMGGATTEISDSTRDVVLEMAWWNPMAIARTSTRLGLRSEASMRFERGADPEICELAARRFGQLLQQIGDGVEVAPGVIDQRGDLPPREPLRLRTPRVNGFLGTDLSRDQISGYLAPIGFEVTAAGDWEGGDDLDVVVPSFRPDTTIEVDVIEEIARHHGYGNIPRTMPELLTTGGLDERQRERREIRQVLVGLGLNEALPIPFLAPDDLHRAQVDANGVTITNPLDANESVLRTSLRPGLLKTIAHNESHRAEGVRLFEVGRVFRAPSDGQALPDEPEWLAVALAGADAIEASGVWRELAEALAVESWSLAAHDVSGLHPTRSAWITVAGELVGAVGEIDPAVADAYGVTERVGWLEVDLDALLAQRHGRRPYRQVSLMPSSDIDLAFEVDEAMPAAAVERTIREAAGDLLGDLRLFDVFRSNQLGEGRRSLAYRLRLQAQDHTLTDAEIADLRSRVIAATEQEVGAKLRA